MDTNEIPAIQWVAKKGKLALRMNLQKLRID
jgi:hypothetical protein